MPRFAPREEIEYEIHDDGGMLYNVQRNPDGTLTGSVRVYGRVEVDGKEYGYDRHIKVRLKAKP